MSTFWKVYFFAAVGYKLWFVVTVLVRGGGAYLALDLVYLFMFVALFGLAFRKRIATEAVWRAGFFVAAMFYLYEWIVSPISLLHAGIAPGSVALIKAYALPLLPLIVAHYRYAWRSDALWGRAAPIPQAGSLWARVRLFFYGVAFLWLALFPVFTANAAHFGWGAMPMFVSIFAMPVVALLLLTDLVVSALARPKDTGASRWRRWAMPAFGWLMFAGYALVVSRIFI